MKRIILDFLKRWSLVLAAIFVAYFAAQAFGIREFASFKSDGSVEATVNRTIHAAHSVIGFQIIMWLGFLMMWEFQRGAPRVLACLPVTPKQIGRSWWLAVVAIPAAVLGILGLLAILFFGGGKIPMVLLQDYAASWVTTALYLASAFGALTFVKPTIPDTITDRFVFGISNMIFGLTIFGMVLLQLQILNLFQTLLIFCAYIFLSVAGWFRAERMVRQRSAARPGVSTGKAKPGQFKAPAGFGGLPFLWQTIFIRLGYMALAVVVWLLLSRLFTQGFAKMSPKQWVEAMLPTFSSMGGFFIFIFLLMPMIAQLRQLRTLPIAASNLAATLVFAPVVPVLIVGAVFAAVSGNIQLNFLMFAAMMAIAVPFFVWRGMRMGTYMVLMVIVMASSVGGLKFLAMKVPASVTALVSLGLMALAFEITRRLLHSSSEAYRPPSALTAGWGGNVWGGGR